MKRGFTLIELLIVIAVIGVLSSIVIVSFPGATKSARDSKRKEELQQYRIALESYANRNNGGYPNLGPGVAKTLLCGSGNPFGTTLTCSDDPKVGTTSCYGNRSCNYNYSSNGTDYVLWTVLEKPSDTTTPKPCFVTCSNGLSGEAVCPTSSACTL